MGTPTQPFKGRLKLLIAGAAFVLVIVVVGYLSISQSNYKSVADLAGVKKRVKVTVEGDVIPMGKGPMTLRVGGKVYEVEGYGSYGVARDSEGRVYAVFILGSGGYAVLALYDVSGNLEAYQVGSGLASSVVVTGVYDPRVYAVLEPLGQQSMAVKLPLLRVDAILKGCHSSYQQGVATRR